MPTCAVRLPLALLVVTSVTACDDPKLDCSKSSNDSMCEEEVGAADAREDGAASEGGVPAVGPLSIGQFCAASVEVPYAWQDAFTNACGSASRSKRDAFRKRVFGVGSERETQVLDCTTSLTQLVGQGNIVFEGSKAQACADAYGAGFGLPPKFSPRDGIDIAMLHATVGHGAPIFAQIAACREAFQGQLARDAKCWNSLECGAGLRCLSAASGGLTCQPALVSGACFDLADCADEYSCVGSMMRGGQTCVATSQLPQKGEGCWLSGDCAVGLVCDDATETCVEPVADVICRSSH